MIPSVSQYAGQQLLTGEQAKVWANDFMAVHLSEMPYGGVYSKVSAAARANPKNTKLAHLRQAVFMGTTLRGLLLQGLRVLGHRCNHAAGRGCVGHPRGHHRHPRRLRHLACPPHLG